MGELLGEEIIRAGKDAGRYSRINPAGICRLHQGMRNRGPADFIDIRMSEEKTHYVISVQLPQLHKEDIHIDVEGRQVTLAVRQHAAKKTGYALWPGIQPARDVSRDAADMQLIHTFFLDADIDLIRAHATYKNGSLDLMLPKRLPVSRRLLVN